MPAALTGVGAAPSPQALGCRAGRGVSRPRRRHSGATRAGNGCKEIKRFCVERGHQVFHDTVRPVGITGTARSQKSPRKGGKKTPALVAHGRHPGWPSPRAGRQGPRARSPGRCRRECEGGKEVSGPEAVLGILPSHRASPGTRVVERGGAGVQIPAIPFNYLAGSTWENTCLSAPQFSNPRNKDGHIIKHRL